MASVISSNTLGLFNSSRDAVGGSGDSQLGRLGERVYANATTGNLVVQIQDELLVGLGLDASLVRTYNSQGLLNDDNGDNWRLNIASLINLPGSHGAGSTVTKRFGDGAEIVYTYDHYDAVQGHIYVSSAGEGAHDTLSFNTATQQWTWTEGSNRVSETYNSSGQLTNVRDVDGNSLTYTYIGVLLDQIHDDASNQDIRFDYSGNNLTGIRTVSQGVTQTQIRYFYDTENRLRQTVVDFTPTDAPTLTDSNSDGLYETVNGQTYVTTYTYDGASRRVMSIKQADGVDADDTTVSFTYVQVGSVWKVASITDGEGKVTSFNYAGSNTQVTDPLLQMTTYVSDSAGRLTQIIEPSGAVTTYGYDTESNLASIVDANGNPTVMQYQNGNLVYSRDAMGNTVSRTYNGANQVLTETVYLVADPDGPGSAQAGSPSTTRYVYDGENHLRFAVSALGRVTEHRYNANGTRSATLRYASGTYTAGGTPTESNVASWAAAQDLAKIERINYTYDVRGQVDTATTFGATSGATGEGVAGTASVTRFIYDQRGQLLQTIDARGSANLPNAGNPNLPYATTFVYDGLGRIVSSTQWIETDATTGVASTRVSLTEYDDENRRTTITLENGLLTTSTFDRRGLLTSVAQADGAQALGATNYQYDADGNLRITTDPTGVKTYYLYDADDRQIAVIDQSGAVVEKIYDAADNLVRIVAYASRLTAGELASLSNVDNQAVTLLAIRPDSVGDDRSTYYVYNAAKQIVFVITPADTGGQGYVTQSFYDGTGRVIRVKQYGNTIAIPGSVDVASVTASVSSISNDSVDRQTRNFHDSDGKTVATLDGEGYLREFFYSDSGRLIKTVARANPAVANLRAAGTLTELQGSVGTNTLEDQYTYTFYDNRGLVVATLDAENYLTEYAYDAVGNQTQTMRYYQRATSYTGSQTLAQLRPTDLSAFVTVTAYNAANQVTQLTTNPAGTITRFTYNDVGALVRTDKAWNTAEVRTTRARYDAQGRVTRELTGEGSVALDAFMAANPAATLDEQDPIWNRYGITHVYDDAGRRTATLLQQTSATDPNGKTLYYYNVVGQLAYTVNALGEVTETIYNAFGQIQESIRYANRIDTLGLAGGFAADDTVFLGRLEDAQSEYDSSASFNYTLRGAIREAVDVLGKTTRYTYNAFGQTETRVDPINTDVLPGNPAYDVTVTRYDYDRRGLLTESIEDYGAGRFNRTTANEYDAFGRVTETTDARGTPRRFSYDKLGRTIAVVTDPANLNIGRSSSYDALARVLTQTDALGNSTSYVYDDAARSFSVTTSEGIRTITRANRHGETFEVELRDAGGQSVTLSQYSYDKNGNLTGVVDAAGALNLSTAHEYDSANRKILTRNANGVYTRFEYDAANRLLARIVDPTSIHASNDNPTGLNLAVRYGYDGQGRVLTTTDAEGVVTKTFYDLKGQVTDTIVDPTTISEPNDNPEGLNLRTHYEYDEQGRTLVVIEAPDTDETRRTEYRYDHLGRRIEDIKGAGVLDIRCTYAYDLNGNLIAKTEGTGSPARVTRYAYDAAGRLVFTVDAMGVATESVYDDNGNVTMTLRYGTALTAAVLAQMDANPTQALTTVRNNLVTLNSGERSSMFVYDRDNRQRYSVDALGVVTERRYNALGKVTDVVTYATALDSSAVLVAAGFTVAQVQAMNADQLRGALATALTPATIAAGLNIANPLNHQIRTVYDAAGRVVFSIDALNFVTKTQYDGNGNALRTVAYAAAISLPGTVNLTTIGNAVNGVAVAANDRVTRSVYDTGNRLRYAIDALGFVKETVFDNLGRVTQVLQYPQAITVSDLPTLEEVRIALAGHVAAVTTVNSTATVYTIPPVQPYTYVASAKSDVATTQTQSATFVNQTTVNSIPPIQPYTYVASAKSDVATTLTQNVNLSANNTSIAQSGNVVNNAWTRSGTTLVSTGGISLAPGSIGFGDSTPTQVKATIYRADGSLVGTVYTDVSYTTPEQWQRVWDSDAVSHWETVSPVTLTSAQQDIPVSLAATQMFVAHTFSSTVSDEGFSGYANYFSQSIDHRVDLTWSSLAAWGDGDVRVTVDTNLGQQIKTVGASDGMTGSVVMWVGSYSSGGTGSLYNANDAQQKVTGVSRVQVEKYINGAWVKVVDRTSEGSYGQQVSWQAPASPGSQTATLRYRVLGSGAGWTNASVSLVGNRYVANFSSLAANRYEYEIAYTPSGQSAPTAQGSGVFAVQGPVTAGTSTVVGTVESPFVSRSFISTVADEGYSGSYDVTFSQLIDHRVDVSWASLQGWGSGDVTVTVDTNLGQQVRTLNAADAMTGAAITWQYTHSVTAGFGSGLTKFNTANQTQQTLSSVSRVQVSKIVNGTSVLVYDTNTLTTTGERLLIGGATSGLTGVNIAGVGTRSATALGGGMYSVNVSDLASGVYSYTPVGSSSTVASTFETRGAGASGRPIVQEQSAYIRKSFGSTVGDEGVSGSTFTQLIDHRVDLNWASLAGWGEGNVRVQVDSNLVSQTRTLSAMDGMSGAVVTWQTSYTNANGATAFNATNTALQGLTGVSRVQVWKTINGVEVLVYDTNSGVTSQLNITNLPTNAQTVTLEYRKAGTSDAYVSKSTTRVNNGWFTASYSDIALGAYDFRLTVRDASNNPINLTSVGGDSAGQITGSFSVKRGGQNVVSSEAALVNHGYGVTNWNGQVNLTTGTLAAGTYTVVLETRDDLGALSLGPNGPAGNYDADGTWVHNNTVNVNVGLQVLPTVVTWANSTQPSGTTVSFQYRTAGSSGAFTTASVGTNGANHQVSLAGLAAGNYEYLVRYTDSYGRIVKSATGNFASNVGQTTNTTAAFAYTQVTSTPSAGSSIRGYINLSDVPAIEYVDATVTDSVTGAVISTARTYPEFESGYQGEVNLKVGSVLANGSYNVAVVIRWKNGTVEPRPSFLYQLGNQGTLVQNIFTWPTSTQPAGTTATFGYRPSGSTGAFSSGTIVTSGANRQVTLDNLANGSYEYQIIYRDSYNRIVKSANGTFAASGTAGTVNGNATFSYTQVTSSASAGSSIRNYIGLGDVPAIDYVDATVTDRITGATVSTARTYPEFEAGYQGEVNLKVGSLLANGSYNVAVVIRWKNGTVETRPVFVYEVGMQPTQQRTTVVSWDATNKPVGTTAQFTYALAGSSNNPVSASITTIGSSKQVSFTDLALGTYTFTVRYVDDLTGDVRLQSTGQFAVNASGTSAGSLSFAHAAANDPRVTTYRYDAVGRLASVTDAMGQTESYAYDDVGNKTSFTNKRGSTWTYAYDQAGRLTDEYTPEVWITRINPDTLAATSGSESIRTHIVYDTHGNVTGRYEAYLTAEERFTQYRYDAVGRQTQTIFPTAGVYNYVADLAASYVGRNESNRTARSTTYYDIFGNAVANRNPNDRFTYKAYDDAGRVKYEIDAERYLTEYGYDAFGNQLTLRRYAVALNRTSENGVVDESLFAAREQGATDESIVAFTVAEIAALVQQRAVAYPTINGNDRTLTNSYDKRNQLTESRQPQVFNYDAGVNHQFEASPTTTNTYNAFGQVTRQSTLVNYGTDNIAGNGDDRWARTYFYYNRLGQRIAQVDALGYATRYEYDANGNRVAQTEYAQQLASGSWNLSSYGTPVSTTPADASSVSANGFDRTTQYGYDDLNRKIEESRVRVQYTDSASTNATVGNLTTTYEYDEVGNLLSVTDPSGATTRSYFDALGRITATTGPVSGIPPSQVSTIPAPVVTTDYLSHTFISNVGDEGLSGVYEIGFTQSIEHRVDLEWGSLEAWGDGGVEVTIFTNLGEQTRTFRAADAKQGAVISWASEYQFSGGLESGGGMYADANTPFHNLSSISRVVVRKKVSNTGTAADWATLIDRNNEGVFGKQLRWAAPAATDTQTSIRYRRLGSTGAWTTVTPTRMGDAYVVNVNGLAADRYEYETTYVLQGVSTSRTGVFDVQGAAVAGTSANVVGTVDHGTVGISFDSTVGDEGFEIVEIYTNILTQSIDHRIDLSWSSLAAWGDGEVRVEVVTNLGTVNSGSGGNSWISAAEGMTGATISWRSSYEVGTSSKFLDANDAKQAIQDVSRVRVWKRVNGVDVLVHDTAAPETAHRLLLGGATQLLTGPAPGGGTRTGVLIDINGVETFFAATNLGGGFYSVDIGTLARGTYSYRGAGASTSNKPSFTYVGVVASGAPSDLTSGSIGYMFDSTVGDEGVGGFYNSTLYQLIDHRVDLHWDSLVGWGDGEVEVHLETNLGIHTATFDSADAVDGAIVAWQQKYETSGGTSAFNASNTAKQRITHIDRVQVWKLLNGTRILAYDTARDSIVTAGDEPIALTQYQRDVFGQVVEEKRFANGAISVSASEAVEGALDALNDQVMYSFYDKFGRTVRTVDALKNSSFSSYDAAGNVMKQWHLVTDENGIAKQATTVYTYDKLGRRTAAADIDSTPLPDPVVSQTYLAYTFLSTVGDEGASGFYDSGFNQIIDHRIDLSWNSLAAWGDGEIRVRVNTNLGEQTQIFDAQDVVNGAVFGWSENYSNLAEDAKDLHTPFHSISSISHVQVWKRVGITGIDNLDWALIIDRNGEGVFNHQLSWNAPVEPGTQATVRYWRLGSSNDSVVTATLIGSAFVANLGVAASDRYGYEITYLRNGETIPYARSTGEFQVQGLPHASSTNVVGIVEAPYVSSFFYTTVGDEATDFYGSGFAQTMDHRVDVSWAPLTAWGDGEVEVTIQTNFGTRPPVVLSAADGMNGAVFTWQTEYTLEGSSGSGGLLFDSVNEPMHKLTAVSRVLVRKRIGNDWVVAYDTNSLSTNPRLLLSGKTQNLTAINIDGVGTRQVTPISSTANTGLYTVDLGGLSSGSYSYTVVNGTSSPVSGKFELSVVGAAGVPVVQERPAAIELAFDSTVGDEGLSGYGGEEIQQRVDHRIDLSWMPLTGLGAGDVRVDIDTNLGPVTRTLSAANGMAGAVIMWSSVYTKTAPGFIDPANEPFQRISSISRVQVWKKLGPSEDDWALVYDRNNDSRVNTGMLTITNVPVSAQSATFEIRSPGDPYAPFKPLAVVRDATGFFRVDYRGIPNGRYDYRLTVSYANGTTQQFTGPIDIGRGKPASSHVESFSARNSREAEYNAFGEIVAKGLNGSRPEYFTYDQAGRMWKTNTGDGVDKIFAYGLQGQASSEFISASLDLGALASASAAFSLDEDDVRRTRTIYDMMGRATDQLKQNTTIEPMPERIGTALTVNRTFLSYDFISTVGDENKGDFYSGAYTQIIDHRVDLEWASLAAWGDSDVRVRVETNLGLQTQIFSAADAVEGVVMQWQSEYEESTNYTGEGQAINGPQQSIQSIAHVYVWKRVGNVGAESDWKLVLDKASEGTFGQQVSWQAPPFAVGTEAVLSYWRLGSGDVPTNVSPTLVGKAYVVDLGNLPADRYGYQITYSRINSNEPPYASGQGEFYIQGRGTAASRNAVVTVESPYVSKYFTSTVGDEGVSGMYDANFHQSIDHRVDLSWASLAAWGDGDVTVNVDTNFGSRPPLVLSAADGMNGAVLTWQTSYNSDSGLENFHSANGPASGHQLTSVGRVQVWKNVAGIGNVLVYDTNALSTNERLLISGATAGLTGINIEGVGTRSVSALGGGMFTVDVSDLASGTYIYTPVGAVAQSGKFEVHGRGLVGKPAVQEQLFSVAKTFSSKVGDEGFSGFYNVNFLQSIDHRIDLSWPSLAGWGDGQVRVQVDTNLGQVASGVPGNAWISAAQGMAGTVLAWRANYVDSSGDGLGKFDAANQAGQSLSSISRVQIWKMVNGQEVLVYDTDTAATSKLTVTNLPADAHSVTFDYRLKGDTSAPYIQKTATRVGAGWFTIDNNDMPIGEYSYLLTVRNSAGGAINLSGVGGTAQGEILGDVSITRGGQSVVGLTIAGTQLLTPRVTQELDRWGNVVKVYDIVDPSIYTSYRYNYQNSVVNETKPLVDVLSETGGAPQRINPQTHYAYDSRGMLVKLTDANGNVNKRVYDSAGNVTLERRGDGSFVDYDYDALGRQITRMDGNGNITSFVYDRKNRLVEEQMEEGVTHTYSYDEDGRRLSFTNGENETTRYGYDAFGRLIRTTTPMGHADTVSYDAMGRKISGTNANGDTQTSRYDYFGRLLRSVDMAGIATNYEYDEAAGLVSQTSDRGQELSYEYYANGAVKRITDNTLGMQTYYEYDAAGHKTLEVFRNYATGEVLQDIFATYDELGRLKDVQDMLRYDIHYSYDAAGNRRRILSNYTDDDGTNKRKDYWYKYDGMNRITVADGVMHNNQIVIVAGRGSNEQRMLMRSDGVVMESEYVDASREEAQGAFIYYDGAGNRVRAVYWTGSTDDQDDPAVLITDTYRYDHLNRLTTTLYRKGTGEDVVKSEREYDDANRVTLYIDYDSAEPNLRVGTRRTTEYNDDGWMLRQESYDIVTIGGLEHTSTVRYNYADSYDAMGNTLKYTVKVYGENSYTNTYTYNYEKRTSYLEKAVYGASTYFDSGNSTSTYDVNGNIVQVYDPNATYKKREFVSNTQGLILRKTQVRGGKTKVQYHYYVDGKPVGTVGNLESDDFSYNYTPVSAQYPATTPGKYVINSGDTLQSIASAVYGDASLWYFIADANGIDAGTDLVEGQTLTIPNQITNLHNTSDTFKVYNPREIIGDTTPVLPPPPVKECPVVLQIISIVFTIVLTYFLGPAGAMLANVITQAIAVEMGYQSEIDWAGVVISGVASAAGGAAGSAVGGATGSTVAGAIAQGAVSSATTQGLNIMMGRQDKFDWRAVAVSAIAAGVMEGIGVALEDGSGATADAGALRPDGSLRSAWDNYQISDNSFVNDFSKEFLRGVVNQTVKIAIYGEGKFDWKQVAVDAFGTAIGNSIVGELQKSKYEEELARENARLTALQDVPEPEVPDNSGGGYGRYSYGAPVEYDSSTDPTTDPAVDPVHSDVPDDSDPVASAAGSGSSSASKKKGSELPAGNTPNASSGSPADSTGETDDESTSAVDSEMRVRDREVYRKDGKVDKNWRNDRNQKVNSPFNTRPKTGLDGDGTINITLVKGDSDYILKPTHLIGDGDLVTAQASWGYSDIGISGSWKDKKLTAGGSGYVAAELQYSKFEGKNAYGEVEIKVRSAASASGEANISIDKKGVKLKAGVSAEIVALQAKGSLKTKEFEVLGVKFQVELEGAANAGALGIAAGGSFEAGQGKVSGKVYAGLSLLFGLKGSVGFKVDASKPIQQFTNFMSKTIKN